MWPGLNDESEGKKNIKKIKSDNSFILRFNNKKIESYLQKRTCITIKVLTMLSLTQHRREKILRGFLT
jgi:hypothetical protein